MSDHDIIIEDPVAAEMIYWRTQCESTIRLNAYILNRGRDNLETSFWDAARSVINGSASAEQAAAKVQKILGN